MIKTTCGVAESIACRLHRGMAYVVRAHLDSGCLWVELCHQLVQGAKIFVNLLCQFSTWGLILLHGAQSSLIFASQCDEVHNCMHAWVLVLAQSNVCMGRSGNICRVYAHFNVMQILSGRSVTAVRRTSGGVRFCQNML